jgi:hypothetical protein
MIAADNKVSPFDAWSIGTACRLHFSAGSYDAFKFNFKGPRLKQSSFLARKDRFFYEKIARNYSKRGDCIGFFTANILAGKNWIGDMSPEIYLLWQSKLQALQYNFKSELSVCRNRVSSFDGLFLCDDGFPPIYTLYADGTLSLESVTVLDSLCNYSARLKKNASDPLGILSEYLHTVSRYRPFIASKINAQSARHAIIQTYSS